MVKGVSRLPRTASKYRTLDIRDLRKRGLLRPGRIFDCPWVEDGYAVTSMSVLVEADAVRLSYKHLFADGKSRRVSYPVVLEWTQCNYGGLRPWFRCPVAGCGRRVAILYARDTFACRHCYDLKYRTQREQPWMRELLRAKKIRKKLGGGTGLLDLFPPKPKGMHWRTYRRLCLEASEAELHGWPGSAPKGRKRKAKS